MVLKIQGNKVIIPEEKIQKIQENEFKEYQQYTFPPQDDTYEMM